MILPILFSLIIATSHNPIQQRKHHLKAIAKVIARRTPELASRHAFSRKQELDDLIWIIQRESEMKSNMHDPHSSASGLGGLLVGTYRDLKMHPTKDERLQLKAMMLYVNQRYGSASQAKNFWRVHKYY